MLHLPLSLPPMMARTAVPGIAALALALAGCASMAPGYQRPAAALPGQYADGGPADRAPPERPPAADTGWRDYFADPALQGLIAQALARNHDLRLAALRVEEARAAYGIQRADRFPSVGVEADGSRSRTPADLNLAGRPLLSNQFQLAVGVSNWELDFWGRVRSLEDAALQSFLASDAARRAAGVSLVAQVAQGYLALRTLDERIALARQTEASRAESMRIFGRRVEVGATSRLDFTQVQTLWQQARALRVQLEQARATQAHALELLLGGPPDAPARAAPAGEDADSGILVPLAPGLPSDLLRNRPDLIAAEHRLKAANASIGAARAAFFPRIALTGAFGTASAELDGLFGSGSRAWRFAPSISLPIFTAGRLRNSLDLAEVRRDMAVAQYEQVVQSAFRDVADALSARYWLAQQVEILRGMRLAQAERARMAQLRYDNGAARYLEVLDAQRDLLAAEQELVQARGALLASQVGLYAALGGGQLERSFTGTAAPIVEQQGSPS